MNDEAILNAIPFAVFRERFAFEDWNHRNHFVLMVQSQSYYINLKLKIWNCIVFSSLPVSEDMSSSKFDSCSVSMQKCAKYRDSRRWQFWSAICDAVRRAFAHSAWHRVEPAGCCLVTEFQNGRFCRAQLIRIRELDARIQRQLCLCDIVNVNLHHQLHRAINWKADVWWVWETYIILFSIFTFNEKQRKKTPPLPPIAQPTNTFALLHLLRFFGSLPALPTNASSSLDKTTGHTKIKMWCTNDNSLSGMITSQLTMWAFCCRGIVTARCQ